VTIWLDNQLPPALSSFVRANLGVDCISVRDLTLQRAADLDIFHAARAAGALLMTKDADFAELVYQLGAPPQNRAGHLREHLKCPPAAGPRNGLANRGCDARTR